MTIRLSHASRQNPGTNACVRFNVGHRPDDRSARRRGPIDAMTSRSRTSGDVGGVRRAVAGSGVSRCAGATRPPGAESPPAAEALSRDDRGRAEPVAGPRRASASAAVRAGVDLEGGAARIFPVDAPPSVVRVVLTKPLPPRVGPVRQPAIPYPAEDLVEVGFADQERIVLRIDRAVIIGEVEGHLVVDLHDEEGAVGRRLTDAENLGEERRRFALVAYRHDRVIQLDAHANSSHSADLYRPHPLSTTCSAR